MKTALLCLLLGFTIKTSSASNSDKHVTRFLDSDVRPDAVVIEPSSSVVSENKTEIRFEGVLGSIEGDRLSSFVGFTGIQIPAAYFQKSPTDPKNISFDLNFVRSDMDQNVLTVQLVDAKDEVYSIDLDLNKMKFVVGLSQFKKSVRGSQMGQSYAGSDVKQVRIFFRRSKNAPDSSQSIQYEFTVAKKSLTFF